MSTQLLLWLKKNAPDIHQRSLFGQKSGAILAHASHVLLSFDLHLCYLRYHNISNYRTHQYPILSNMNQGGRGEGIPAQGLPIFILAPKLRSIELWLKLRLRVPLLSPSIGGRRFMLLTLLEDTGNVSKHWELVPLANSYNVRLVSSLLPPAYLS